jgi:hypothetical protein
MTAPVQRPDMARAIGDALRRIRILEQTIPRLAEYEIKVFGDDQVALVEDGAFRFAIPEDVDGYTLTAVAAFVGTVGSSDVAVQIQNNTAAVDMLSTGITIDAGEFTSYTAATPPVIDEANATVTVADMIWVDVDSDGTDALGLGVMLRFNLV